MFIEVSKIRKMEVSFAITITKFINFSVMTAKREIDHSFIILELGHIAESSNLYIHVIL